MLTDRGMNVAATGMTIGDLAGFIEIAKSGVLGTNVTDFDMFFDKIEQMLKATGQWTDELAEKLSLAEAQLKANPELFEIGKQTFIDSVDALLEKYPPDTLLSDIPEFQGGTGPVDPDPTDPIDIVVDPHGLNTAVLAALREGVTVEYNAETGVVGLHGMGVEVTLPDVDRVQFGDGTLAFDIDGISGRVFRLYQAVFGREPDAEGLGYWIKHQDADRSSFQDVIRSFMDSPEFAQRYGSETSLSDTGFITLLYENVLGRSYDAEGFAYWTEKLETGQTNRPDLLAFFSDSDENVALTADAVSDGIWFV